MMLRQIQHFQIIVQENSFTEAAELSLGVLSTYSGDEFNRAIAVFSEKYPTVELKVSSGNHEDLYDGLRFGKRHLFWSNDQTPSAPSGRVADYKKVLRFLEEG